jgi:hypothetical protein
MMRITEVDKCLPVKSTTNSARIVLKTAIVDASSLPQKGRKQTMVMANDEEFCFSFLGLALPI